jgi:hypothetical protein
LTWQVDKEGGQYGLLFGPPPSRHAMRKPFAKVAFHPPDSLARQDAVAKKDYGRTWIVEILNFFFT